MRVTLTAKLTNLWPSFPDRIGIWSVGFCGGRKTGEHGETPLQQERTNNKLSPHVMPGLGIESGTQRWEASALTTAPYPTYTLAFYPSFIKNRMISAILHVIKKDFKSPSKTDLSYL